jgi:pyrimidine deaminase RibD-like protein
MVGSVIVYENRIIGKVGIKAGELHAEVNAIN